MMIDGAKEPARQQQKDYIQHSAPKERSRRPRPFQNNAPHTLEHIRRGQEPRYKSHPGGQGRERVEDAGQRRNQRRNRPDEPLGGRSKAQNNPTADNSQSNSEQEKYE